MKGLLGTNFEKLMFPLHQGKMKGRFNLTFSSQVTLEVTFTTVQRIITIPERSQSQNCQDVLFFIYSDMPLASKDVNFDKVKSLYMQNLWSSNSTPFTKLYQSTQNMNPQRLELDESFYFFHKHQAQNKKNTNLPMSTLIESSRKLHPIWCLN